MGTESQHSSAIVPQEATEAPPRVVPGQPVVILRESELDCDLATAIERVRRDDANRQRRILIVGAEEESADPSEQLPVPRMPSSILQVARQAGDAAVVAAGSRAEPKLRSLIRFFEEIRAQVAQAEEDSVDGSRAHTQGQLRAISEVLAWMEATGDDLMADVAGMATGCQQVDLADLAHDLRVQVESFFPHVRVALAPPGEEVLAWGRAAGLAEVMFLSTVIVAHRVGGKGTVQLELTRDREHARVRLLGLGEPQPVDLEETTARLRTLVEELGGRITPDVLGPFGTGMILEFRVTP